MYCTECGYNNSDASVFCTHCGKPLQQITKSTKKVPVIAWIAIIVAIIAVVIAGSALVLTLSGNQEDDQTDFDNVHNEAIEDNFENETSKDTNNVVLNTSENVSTSNEIGTTSAVDVSISHGTLNIGMLTAELDGIRIKLPENLASRGYSWDIAENRCLFEFEGTTIAQLVWGENAQRENEAKTKTYLLSVNGDTFATLRIYYLDENNKTIHWNHTENGRLATDVLGISFDDILRQISHSANGVFVPATAVESSDAKQAKQQSGTPFWGVWIGAAKTRDSAVEIANAAKTQGLTADVYFTLDWQNLNTEPWYVISVGHASSQQEAERLCNEAHTSGYPDAYVKHTGDHA